MAKFAQIVQHDYGVKIKPITTRNPQANSIIERVHQTIGNIIRTFEMNKKTDIDEEDPWSGVLSATMFATRATYHMTNQTMLTQLVFGRDAILNTTFEANWQYIRERKQKIINENNKKENLKRIPHRYHVGDKALYRNDSLDKFSTDPYDGPFKIVQVNNNGTVHLRMDKVMDTVNIHLLKPYKE